MHNMAHDPRRPVEPYFSSVTNGGLPWMYLSDIYRYKVRRHRSYERRSRGLPTRDSLDETERFGLALLISWARGCCGSCGGVDDDDSKLSDWFIVRTLDGPARPSIIDPLGFTNLGVSSMRRIISGRNLRGLL
jgi:hypothetical protein